MASTFNSEDSNNGMSLHPHDELEMLDQSESYQRRRETINNVGASLADRMTNTFFLPSYESSSRLPQPASPPQPTPSPRPASSLTPASTPLSLSPQQFMLLNLTASPPPSSSPPAPTSASLLSSPVLSPRHTLCPPVVLTRPESPPASLSSILVASPPQMPPHVYLTQPSHETQPPLLRSASSPSLLSSVTSFPPPSASSAPSSPSLLPRAAVIQPSIEQETYTFKSYKTSPHSSSPIFVNVFFHGNNSTEPACELSTCQLSPPRSPTFMDYFFPNLLYPLSHNITDSSDPKFLRHSELTGGGSLLSKSHVGTHKKQIMESSRPDTWLYMIALIVALMVLAICLILLLCALLMMLVPLIMGILISILSIILIAFVQLVFKGADIVRRDASIVINFTTDRYQANVSSRPFSNGSYARVDSCHQVETKESKDQVETFVSSSELVIAKCTALVPNNIAATMNIRPNSEPIHPSGDIIAFNHEHGGQNESGQRDSDVSKESLETGSPNELSTENDEFFYQSAEIETVTDTYDSTAFVYGQLSSTLTTAATLDGELVCGLCEKDKNKLVNDQSQREPPCETPSKVQEQIDSDDYSDTKEMVCVNNTAVKTKTQDLPSVLINEAVVADAPTDTSDISDSELYDGDDTDDRACAGGDPASKLEAEMLSEFAASTSEKLLFSNTTIIPLTELGFLYRDSTSASTSANSLIVCIQPMLPHFPGELECGVKWRDKRSEPPSDTSSASSSPMMKYL